MLDEKFPSLKIYYDFPVCQDVLLHDKSMRLIECVFTELSFAYSMGIWAMLFFLCNGNNKLVATRRTKTGKTVSGYAMLLIRSRN